MRDFKPGDIVQLRTGGPKMTISSVDESSDGTMEANCDWFVADKETWKEEFSRFPLTSLKAAPEW
jgi:uncharacterized protein YodC (DUF2158 family)